jgi:hypothetical protein
MENSGIKKVFGKITVDKVEADRYKESLDSAQIRQIVTKIYPSASVSNNKQDSLFSTEDFGLEGGSEYTEERVTWIPVPKGTTAEQVQAMLDKKPDAKIYKVLSHEPILTDGQEYALEAGLIDLETIAEKQMVRDGEGSPILFNDEVQFSAKFFSLAGKEDEDLRGAEEVKAEEAKTSDLARG